MTSSWGPPLTLSSPGGRKHSLALYFLGTPSVFLGWPCPWCSNATHAGGSKSSHCWSRRCVPSPVLGPQQGRVLVRPEQANHILISVVTVELGTKHMSYIPSFSLLIITSWSYWYYLHSRKIKSHAQGHSVVRRGCEPASDWRLLVP